ncbi:MAG: hypothetical protein CME70_01445, partial [Halobacteriovorax sp.]|nr:hypothetical protein [Halobacteriovorax sp.]
TLYAERQVIEVDLSHEGELFVSGNVTMQDQTSGGTTEWANFLGPTSSTGNLQSGWPILSLDSESRRVGFGKKQPDATVHIRPSNSGHEWADTVFDPSNSSDDPLKIKGLYEYDPSLNGDSSARNLVIDQNGVVKYGYSTIGAPCAVDACDPGETDETFTDGLFIDWDENTPLGCALDRVNEVLGQLAPPPAPLANCLGGARHDYDQNFGSSDDANTMLSVMLSEPSDPDSNWTGFGETVDDTDFSSAGPTGHEGKLSAVGDNGVFAGGVNATYTGIDEDTRGASGPTEAEDDFQLGAMWSGCTGSGPWLRFRLNFDDLGDGVSDINYPAEAWGRGETGTLELYLNDHDTPIHISADLSDNLAAHNSFNSNDSGFVIGPCEPAHFDTGEELCTYFHREYCRVKIAPEDMRLGWNFVKVIHRHPAVANGIHTNYITWLIDDNTTAPTVTGTSLAIPSFNTATRWLSGVEYHTNPSGNDSLSYVYTVNGAFRHFYHGSSLGDAKSWDVNSKLQAATSEALPNPAGAADTDTGSKVVKFVQPTGGASTWNLNEDVTVDMSVVHPFDDTTFGPAGWVPCTNQGPESWNGCLLYNPSTGDTGQVERFRTEDWRLTADGTDYDDQTDLPAGGEGDWDQQELLTSGQPEGNGLMCFNDRLSSPSNTSDTTGITDGDFTVITYPANSADYQGITANTTRTFYRRFVNNTSAQVAEFGISLQNSSTLADSTIVPTGVGGAENLNGNDEVHVLIKLPDDSPSFPGTGWLDLAKLFVDNNWADGDGCADGSGVSAIPSNSTVQFGTRYVDVGNSIVVKIIARESWTGGISQIDISW